MSNKAILAAALLAGGLVFQGAAAATEVTVYKNAACGCCSKWAEHMRTAGFTVITQDVDDLTAVKQRYGVPAALGSCHTALVGRYVVEGHVPPSDVERLLRENPAVTGIAVPGMPASAPGMDSARHQPYQTVTFTRTGAKTLFAQH
jgi:hypothetical protein